jgi:hypothetical protein
MTFLEASGYLQQACVFCHQAEDTNGLTPTELLMLIGLMVVKLRKKEEEFISDNTFPVSLSRYLSYPLTQSSFTRS